MVFLMDSILQGVANQPIWALFLEARGDLTDVVQSSKSCGAGWKQISKLLGQQVQQRFC